jgi:hypothetical protein
LKPRKKLDGQQAEELLGQELFDTNAFAVLATPDESCDGVYKVSREDLLKTLRVHQVVSNATAKVPPPPLTEMEKLEALNATRANALRAPRPAEDLSEARGSIGPLVHSRSALFVPPMPANADSRTLLYPYAAAMVLILRKRFERGMALEGWDVSLFRNRVTGEWGAVSANYASRHHVTSSPPNGLRNAAAEALYEQTCGLFRCSPVAISRVLDDSASVSVVWDGGPHVVESQGSRPRNLIQIFAIVLEGFESEYFVSNRAQMERNLAGSPGPSNSWFEFEDVTWVALDEIGAHPIAKNSITDTLGRIISCRRLMQILSYPVVPSQLTTLPNAEGYVLPELVRKLGLMSLGDGDVPGTSGLTSSDNGSAQMTGEVLQAYHENRWFGVGKSNADLNSVEGIEGRGSVELRRHSELGGGLLAGCVTANLANVSSKIIQSEFW